MSAAFIAVHELGERTVTVHAEERGVARYRTPDQGSADLVLRAHGWRRVSAWSDADDVPSGARRAMVERLGDTWPDAPPGVKVVDEVEQLERDQEHGRARRRGAEMALRAMLSPRTPEEWRAIRTVAAMTPAADLDGLVALLERGYSGARRAMDAIAGRAS